MADDMVRFLKSMYSLPATDTRWTVSMGSLLMLLWLSLHVAAAPGEFDPAFGQNGIAILATASDGMARHVTTDSAGRVLATGRDNNLALVTRLLANGTIDTTFNGSGFIRSTPGLIGGAPVYGNGGLWLVPATNGRWLSVARQESFCTPAACGLFYLPGIIATRFNADGTPDSSYGVAGLTLGDESRVQIVAEPDGAMIAVSADKGFLLGGMTTVKRINADGTPDASFNATMSGVIGCLGLPPEGGRYSRAKGLRLADGSFLLAQGIVLNPNPQASQLPPTFNPYRVCISRLNANGTPDLSYGSGGEVLLDTLLFTSAQHMPVALMPTANGGAALLLQQTRPQPASSHYVIVWLTATGGMDTSRFDQGLTGPTGLHAAVVTAAAMQPDGKIVLTGYPEIRQSDPNAPQQIDYAEPHIGRLHPQGGNDLTFGTGGQGYTSLLSFGKRLVPNQIHLAADGNIFVAGATNAAGPVNGGDPTQFAVAKIQGGPMASPVDSAASGGGGGCFTTRDPRIDPLLPSLVLLAMVMLTMRRRRR